MVIVKREKSFLEEERGVCTMFSRKPQTALTAKKEMKRNHKQTKKNVVAMVKPLNGYTNANGVMMPY